MIKHILSLLLIYFSAVELLFSQTSIAFNSCYPNTDWEISTPEDQGVDSELLLKMFEFIDSSSTLDFHSILIVRNGYLVTEAYFSPYNKHTTHNIKSASKSILSALVGIALENKYLTSLDQRVSEFYPEYVSDSLKQTISLLDLLTMTAGFDWMEDSGPSPYDLNNWNLIPMRDQPGEKFEYNTMLTHMMSAILTKVTNLNTEEFARKFLFAPLDIVNYQWRQSSNGIYHGGSDIFLTPRDMAKFGYLFLRNGKWNDKQIVPEDWIEESTKKQVNIPENVNYAKKLGYGYWWWITEKGYMAWGSGGQYINVNPDLDLVVVITASGHDDINQYAEFMNQFLENYIYSAVISNGSLKAKPVISEKLNSIIDNLENPEKWGFIEKPNFTSIISSNQYIFKENNLGFNSTSFVFSDSLCVWEYNIAGQTVKLKVGLQNEYFINDIGYSMGVNPTGDKIACKGFWDDDCFTIEHHIIGDPTKQMFRFNFDENSINMDLKTYGLDLTLKGIRSE